MYVVLVCAPRPMWRTPMHDQRDAEPGNPRWRLIPRYLLRRAGFGSTLLESLADPGIVAAAARYRDRIADAARARETLLRDVLPTAVTACRDAGDRAGLRLLSAVRGAIGRRRTPRGVDALPPAVAGPVAALLAADTAREEAEAGLRAALAADSIGTRL